MIIIKNRFVARLVCIAMVVLAFASCTDDKPVDGEVVPTAIAVTDIIVNPKTPVLGDTVQLTVVIKGSGTNPGDFPVIAWSVDGGTLLNTNRATVKWVTTAPGIFNVSVTARNAANSSSSTGQLFVAAEAPTPLVTKGGELHLDSALPNPDFWYLVPSELTFGTNIMVWLYNALAKTNSLLPSPCNTFNMCGNYLFSPDLSHAAYVNLQLSFSVGTWADIFLADLGSRTFQRLTTDGVTDPSETRRYEFGEPAFSPGSDLLAYEGLKPNPALGAIDTFDVYIYDIIGGGTTNVTKTHGGFRKNFLPTFSSDGNWYVWVSDRNGTGIWELWGLPAVGGVPVSTDSVDVVQMTSTGGLIASGAPLELIYPRVLWNPDPGTSVAAVVRADGQLSMLATNPTGATTVQVLGISGVSEMVWSDDGLTLFVRSGRKLYFVTPGGVETSVYQCPDNLNDVVLSADREWIVGRVSRGPDSWLILVDVDGARYEVPIPITKSTPYNNITGLRSLMNTTCLLTDSDVVYYLEQASNGNVQIMTIDISSLVQ